MKSDLNKLKSIFNKMSEEGFDLKNYLKWGFYFFDTEKSSLLKLGEELKSEGYKYGGITLMEDNEWRLVVTSIDVLSPEMLHKKNIEFNDLADRFNVALYDGWDVEKVTAK